MTASEPKIDRSISLTLHGDWGQANFHRICSWVTQEFCDRAGPSSRTAILSLRDGGIEAVEAVFAGDADLCVATPTMALGAALSGDGIFKKGAMPSLRALAVLPQNDRLVMAVDAKFGIKSFADLRDKRPPLRIATSPDDGTNFIGFVVQRYMEAHGIDEATLKSWGGEYIMAHRPEQSLFKMRAGVVDAVIQEAIMTPWWADVMADGRTVALPAEEAALSALVKDHGYRRNSLPAGFFPGLSTELPTLDFSDFAILVRDDMPEDVAHLLTWCLVEQRGTIERQYLHLPPEKSPLSYPLEPKRMAVAPVPLHPGAHRYYSETGIL